MEVIDFHFFVGNSACWEFIIIKVLWFTKRKGAYTLSFVFCLVGRTEALHRMPPAGIRVFEVGSVAARCPRIPHFPQSVEFGKLNKMQKGMEVIDFHFFVGNSACWEFIIIKVLWFTKRKGAYTLSFVFCLVGRTEALHRMPPAGIRVFEVGGVAARCPRIPHFPHRGKIERFFLCLFL